MIGDQEWMQSLKAGDVIAHFGQYERVPTWEKVERVTATQIIVCGCRYWKKNGLRVGSDSYSRTRIAKPQQQHKDEIYKKCLREKLRRTVDKVSNMDMEIVAKWLAFIDSMSSETETAT